MIWITGDTHGQFFSIKEFCRRNKTTKDDIIIILGDAGINYSEGLFDEKVKKKVDKVPITLLCIHGNHEQRASEISTYREKEWNGGVVYMENKHPSILFAKDAEVYVLNGIKSIAIGGAYSVDKHFRISRCMPWYANEQPDEIIKGRVEEKLEQNQWKIDIVLSHTVPRKYEPSDVFLKSIDQSSVDKTTENWLDLIEDRLDYKKWYAGHYHTEKKIDKLQIMYKNVEEFTSR